VSEPACLSDVRVFLDSPIPAAVATCSADGTPNVTYLSHVHYVDDRHIALSHQFFNKTRANLDENPFVSVLVFDASASRVFRLQAKFDHEERSGPLFDAMSLRIQAIASQTGVERIFRLLAADVFEVLDVEEISSLRPDAPRAAAAPEPATPGFDFCGLRTLSDRINRAADLESLVGAVLAVLEGVFGFEHSTLLLADESGERLYTIASRGYRETGIGAEVRVGEGSIGIAARSRQILFLSSLDRDLRYARVVRDQAARQGSRVGEEIPLPGLPDAESQVVLPLVVHDDLVGVLAVESASTLAVSEAQRDYLGIVANHVALALTRVVERPDSPEDMEPPRRAPARAIARSSSRRQFTFYQEDDCVFVDGAYLIRNVPGRILWRLLRVYSAEGRTEFSNRELRLDPTIGLPALKDNLESRLILLRKRLEQKCPDVRLVPISRGRFALEVACELLLVERANAAP
jgi:adenylate cyclase